MLVTQSSKLPTRKMAAVIVSGMVIGGIQSGLRMFWPDHPFAPLMADLDMWIQMGVMVAAGYFVRDKA